MICGTYFKKTSYKYKILLYYMIKNSKSILNFYSEFILLIFNNIYILYTIIYINNNKNYFNKI